MNNKQEMFDERYRRVLKRHRQLSRGYVNKLGKNGVIAHHPIGNFRNVISLKALILPIGIFVFLKACIITILGEEAYASQIETLSNGSFGQQVGSFFMRMDPITWPVAELMGAIIG